MFVIAERYVKALIELARSKGKVVETGEELRAVRDLLSVNNTFRVFLTGPVYDFSDKKNVIEKVCQSLKLSKLTTDFLLLLIRKNRLDAFAEIVRLYERYEDKETGRMRVSVTLPRVKKKDSFYDKIKERLEEVTGKKVIMNLEEKREIIGGIVVKLGDTVIDGSIRSRLLSFNEAVKKGI